MKKDNISTYDLKDLFEQAVGTIEQVEKNGYEAFDGVFTIAVDSAGEKFYELTLFFEEENDE